MKITNIDDKGVELITKYEGFRNKPYLCSANVPTIGYGTTRYPNGVKVTLNDSIITKEQALEYFKHDVNRFELDVDVLCTDNLTQNQFNALVSFCYNLGSGALKQSTLLKKVNANPNDITIKDEFLKWVYVGKTKLKGLINRRGEEAQLYFTK